MLLNLMETFVLAARFQIRMLIKDRIETKECQGWECTVCEEMRQRVWCISQCAG